jgi:hypothetical protein
MSRETMAEAFKAYRIAVVEEAAARDDHYWKDKTSPRKPVLDTSIRLIEALGKLGAARAKLDEEILDAARAK